MILKKIKQLKEENKELTKRVEELIEIRWYHINLLDVQRQRIDKAIEYIENNNFYRVITHLEKDIGIVELDKLEILEILKGDRNE